MKSDKTGTENEIENETDEVKRQYLNRTYSDILGGQADGKSLQLVAYLDTALGTARLPEHLAASIEQILGEQTREHMSDPTRERIQSYTEEPAGRAVQPVNNAHQGPRPRRFPPLFPFFAQSRRVSAATTLLLAVAVLALAGAGYAAFPALERLFAAHTGTGAIIAGQLGKEMNLSRSVDGFTVTVKRVYADPNQIAIGLTVNGPSGRAFNNIIPWGDYYETPEGSIGKSPILTDKGGREFSGGMGGEQGAVENGTAPYLLTYEGTGLEGNPQVKELKEIDVRLNIGELTAYERVGENRYEDVIVRGPFIFDLTVPVEQGRTADLHQTVESGRTAVTLERVVTTPTGTRLSLRGAGPNAEVRLIVEGATYTLHPPDGMAIPLQWTADSVWEYISGSSLQDKHGDWELTVTPGQTVSPQDGPPPTQLEGGPWTFHFILP